MIPNNKKNYTENEQIIGIWHDGKKIYRTIIHRDTLAPGNNTIEHNLGLIIPLRVGGYFLANNKFYEPIQRVVPDGIIGYGIGVGDFTTNQFTIQFGTSHTSISDVNLILEYIKK